MAVRHVDLKDDTLTGQVRSAGEGRQTAHLRCSFSLMLQHALSPCTRYYLGRQGVVSMGIARLLMEPQAGAPHGPMFKRRARNDDGGRDERELCTIGLFMRFVVHADRDHV